MCPTFFPWHLKKTSCMYTYKDLEISMNSRNGKLSEWLWCYNEYFITSSQFALLLTCLNINFNFVWKVWNHCSKLIVTVLTAIVLNIAYVLKPFSTDWCRSHCVRTWLRFHSRSWFYHQSLTLLSWSPWVKKKKRTN